MGAGVVALGTSHAMPDLKGQNALAGFDSGSVSASGSTDLADRQNQVAERASRSDPRGTTIAVSQQPGQDLWVSPLHTNYQMSSPFGQRWGVLHPGVDLTAVEGTQYFAASSGTVILARYNGGYGYNVMVQTADGTAIVYGHSSKLLVKEGQQVRAGQLLGLTGNTGFSTGPHCHFSVLLNGTDFVDPVPWLAQRGLSPGNYVG